MCGKKCLCTTVRLHHKPFTKPHLSNRRLSTFHVRYLLICRRNCIISGFFDICCRYLLAAMKSNGWRWMELSSLRLSSWSKPHFFQWQDARVQERPLLIGFLELLCHVTIRIFTETNVVENVYIVVFCLPNRRCDPAGVHGAAASISGSCDDGVWILLFVEKWWWW